MAPVRAVGVILQNNVQNNSKLVAADPVDPFHAEVAVALLQVGRELGKIVSNVAKCLLKVADLHLPNDKIYSQKGKMLQDMTCQTVECHII